MVKAIGMGADNLAVFGVQIDTWRNKANPWGIQIQSTVTQADLLSDALAEATAKLADQATKLQDGTGKVGAYATAVKQVLTAQENVDVENAIAQAGLQGVTDAWGLAEVALVTAQARLTDVKAAYQAGNASAADFTTATNAVTAAQAKLDAQTKTTTADTKTFNGVMGDCGVVMGDVLTPAANAAAAIASIGTAASTAGGQVDALAADIQSMDDILGTGGMAPIPGVQGKGNTIVYAPGQAPYYQGQAGELLNSQQLSSPLVAPGTTTTLDALNKLIASLDAVAASSGQTGSALTKLEEAADTYYETHGYTMPTLADLIGTAATTAATAASILRHCIHSTQSRRRYFPDWNYWCNHRDRNYRNRDDSGGNGCAEHCQRDADRDHLSVSAGHRHTTAIPAGARGRHAGTDAIQCRARCRHDCRKHCGNHVDHILHTAGHDD